MTKLKPLDRLPLKDEKSGHFLCVIETPAGARNKYDYDPNLDALKLSSILPPGLVFPYDFGFIPSTLAEDGDPIDVMVLMDEPAPANSIVPARIIGAIEVEQQEKGGDWVRNDRLLAVPAESHVFSNIAHINELNPQIVEEIGAFFKDYNKRKDVKFRILGKCGPHHAKQLVEAAAARFS